MKTMYLVYMSYPYTRDPQKTTEEVTQWARLILHRHDDVVLLIPHWVFDALWAEDGKLPKGYTHPEISVQEFALINKMDIFVYHPDHISAGVRWEKAFAEIMKIPILTFQQLLEGVRPEKT